MRKPTHRIALGLLLALGFGCDATNSGPSAADGAETVVTGQVTIQGKKVTTGTIIFTPQDGAPIAADVRPDGTYLLKTRAGTHVVSVKGEALERAAANRPIQFPYEVQAGEDVIDLAY